MNKKPRILFAIPTLGAGGAQRIISFLAQNIDSEHFEKHLLVVGKSSDSAFEVDNGTTTFLNKSRVLFGIPSVIYFLYKYKPDVVLSCLDLNVVFGLISPFFSKCRFVIREASVISEIGKFGNGSLIQSKLSKVAFKNAHAIVCQSKDMANDFIKLFSVKPENVFIINNPITEIFSLKEKSSFNQQFKFITIGRLSKEKGHARILEALANLPLPFTYTIIGSGREEENIKRKISELGLKNKVKHISFTDKIGEELRNHDFYLQGSFVEGFPNALLESCVAGVPVIAFNAPGGTKEIIDDGINGYLVDDQADFIAKIEQAVRRDWDPIEISNSVIRKFNKEKIVQDYEDLFTKIIKPEYVNNENS